MASSASGPSTGTCGSRFARPQPDDRRCGVRRRDGERGSGSVRNILLLVSVAVGIFLAVKLVPVVLVTFEFSDAIRQEIEFSDPDEDARQVRARLRARARELGLDVSEEAIEVEKRGDWMHVDARYTIPVELPGGYVYEWELSPSHEGRGHPPIW